MILLKEESLKFPALTEVGLFFLFNMYFVVFQHVVVVFIVVILQVSAGWNFLFYDIVLHHQFSYKAK